MKSKKLTLSIDYYIEIVKEKIGRGGSVYLDYEFIAGFTKPSCKNINTRLPNPLPSKKEMMMASKIFQLNTTGNTRDIDDFLELVLSTLQKSGFVASYKYIGGKFNIKDCTYLSTNYSGKTFNDVFACDPSLTKAIWGWNVSKKTTPLYEKHFIDCNGFLLGVGDWEIILSKGAYHWMVDLGSDVLLYEDIDHRYWIIDIHKKGTEPVEFTGKEDFIEDIKKILEIYKVKSTTDGITLDVLRNELDDSNKVEILLKQKARYKNIPKNQMNTLGALIRDIGKRRSQIFKTTKTQIKFIRKPKIYTNGTLEDFRS